MQGTDKNGRRLQRGDEVTVRCTVEAIHGDYLTIRFGGESLAGLALAVKSELVEKEVHEPTQQHQTAGKP